MALNFSHRPIFPGGLSEDNLVAPMRIGNGYRVEGIQEKGKGAGGGDGFGNASWHDADNCFDYGRERCDMGNAQDSVSKDILDLLPSDPFGMDISTTFTAIKGWLQDLEVDNGGYRMEELREGNRFQMYAELEFLCNNAMWFHTLEPSGFGECSLRVGAPSCNFASGSDCSMDDKLGFGSDYEDVGIPSWSGGDTHMDDGNFFGADELSPHPAMSFCLGYLGLSDLLVVERVCKSLRSTVRGDPLLWRRIHIDQPLNERITDDVLMQLSDRAQGNLQCLSLVECTRITDDGLRRVLEANPKLTKLSVPGCTRLSIEGIVSTLKAFKAMGTQGVKHLHIGGLYGVTQNHFEELKLLMGTDSQVLQHPRKPHFYRRGNLYLSCDDDRDIDIEVCPRCQNLRLVYDCPAEGCQAVGHAPECRACTLCIARCSQCGHCINDSEYEETFCLELLCSSCSKLLIKCSERPDRSVGPTESVVPHEHS
ncbi:hypothetical protein HN51_038384 [Arachis hypogaea]|uniref:F-box domain-containing protein n=2 Tax=Arachis TaxID=3817 RepID=A0A444ZSA5_ARAHY|nr:F-box protein SKIP14 [Arachis duranensis]XP_025691627.1 F-box protein SKIP14 [Arachis hypogaea]QHO04096.1 F-box protein [Arachis hypogaea]RYR17038.1 hypothetical protein Ahy_B03g061842 [Arachis hypogaea]